MNVEFEAKDIQAALGTAVLEGMKSAAGGWDVKKAIADATSKAIADAGLVERVSAMVLRQVAAQVDPLCEEVARTIVPCLRESLIEVALQSSADIILAMRRRGPDQYMSDAEQRKVRDEIFTTLRERIGKSSSRTGGGRP